MSFWNSLFGGSSAAAVADQPSDPVDYNGFTVRATPFKDGGHYQTAGVIEKEIAGVRREHKFIRADRHASHEDAAAFSLSKARQLIDQMGDRLFNMG